MANSTGCQSLVAYESYVSYMRVRSVSLKRVDSVAIVLANSKETI